MKTLIASLVLVAFTLLMPRVSTEAAPPPTPVPTPKPPIVITLSGTQVQSQSQSQNASSSSYSSAAGGSASSNVTVNVIQQAPPAVPTPAPTLIQLPTTVGYSQTITYSAPVQQLQGQRFVIKAPQTGDGGLK